MEAEIKLKKPAAGAEVEVWVEAGVGAGAEVEVWVEAGVVEEVEVEAEAEAEAEAEVGAKKIKKYKFNYIK